MADRDYANQSGGGTPWFDGVQPPAGGMRRIKEVATAPGNWPVIVKLIIFSCMMLILPLASYFLAQSYMSVNYAALLSILVVQVIIILYVIMAFTEEDAGRDESERGQLHNSATRPKQN